MKIGIYVGHGKSTSGKYDSGAINKTLNLHEFNLTKGISQGIHQTLLKYDCDCSLINYNGDMDLPQRINHANINHIDYVFEIHLNSHSNKTISGTEVFYYIGDEKGRKISSAICDAMSKNHQLKNRGAKGSSYYGIVRETRGTAMLIETLFISNDNEVKKVDTTNEQNKFGETIGKSIADVLGLKTKKLPDAPNTSTKTESPYGILISPIPDKNKALQVQNECKQKGWYSRIIKNSDKIKVSFLN